MNAVNHQELEAQSNDSSLLFETCNRKVAKLILILTIAISGSFVFASNVGMVDPTWEITSTYPTKTTSIAIQNDGKVIAAGYDSASGARNKFSVKRLNSNGSLDDTFGINGSTMTGVGISDAILWDVAIQGDGKIIACGFATDSAGESAVALVRYLSNGKLDTNYGAEGIVLAQTPFDIGWGCSRIAIQSDGKVLALSAGLNNHGYDNVIVSRFNSDGSTDYSFGINGHAYFSVGDTNTSPADIKVETDGTIYIAGFLSQTSTGFVARLLSDGTFDTSFGGTGKVVPKPTWESQFNALVLQSDGKVILAGRWWKDPDTVGVMAQRLNVDGSLDSLFGDGGTGFYDLTPYSEFANSVAINSSGEILLGGIWPANSTDFSQSGFVLRITNDGIADSTFGTKGYVSTSGEFGRELSLDSEDSVYLITSDYTVEKFKGILSTNVLNQLEMNCLFNWGEDNYPTLLSPSRSISITAEPYYYRHYAKTNVYIGISTIDNHLYFLDSAGDLADIGLAATWSTESGCR